MSKAAATVEPLLDTSVVDRLHDRRPGRHLRRRGRGRAAATPCPARGRGEGRPRSVNACNELPSDPFTDGGWSCGGVGTALYVYAIDEASGACAITEGLPAVTVVAKGRSVPLAVVEGGFCIWVVVTGRPLPRDARVRREVSFAGAALTQRFSTVVPKPKRKH